MKEKIVRMGAVPPSQTSLTLLEQARKNEKDAWDRLVELYTPMIYSRCRRRWNLTPSESENVSQEVFTSVIRKLKNFERRRNGSFRKWLNTITDNKTKDHLKKLDASAAAGGSTARQLIESIPDSLGDEALASASDGRCEIMRQALQSIKNEFSDRDIQIFWKVVVENKYRADIAKDFGVSTNTLYIVCSRIRKRLREIYEDLIDPDIIQEDVDDQEIDS